MASNRDQMQPPPSLDKERQIKYWQRCYANLLPTAYTSADSTRLTFACFIVCARDLLSVPLPARDRASIRAWVLALQHPDGGFCGSPTHALPGQASARGTANLAATFFALVLLGLAGEGDGRTAFAGVRRRRTLAWLRRLQREDGSFGQLLWEGRPEGGRDTRHAYLASSIRWMLRGWERNEHDLNADKLIECVRAGQTYDGGLSETSHNESHSGYSFCGVAALSMLDRETSTPPRDPKSAVSRGIADMPGLLHFLAMRQFAYQQEGEDETEDDENYVEASLGDEGLAEGKCRHVGFNGRCNKKADTCYCWWVGGALMLLDADDIINRAPARNFITELTQHTIGGFSKVAGAPPDIFHSYLGLAILAAMGSKGDLKELDVGLCCSKETAARIARASEGLLEMTAGEQ